MIVAVHYKLHIIKRLSVTYLFRDYIVEKVSPKASNLAQDYQKPPVNKIPKNSAVTH